MNILFICDEYPPGKNGGIGTMVQVLGRELVRQGHNVIVVGLYPYYYGEKDFEIDQGVEVHRLRYGINFGRKTRNFFYKVMGKLPDFIKKRLNGKKAFEKFIGKINLIIEEKKIDIIEMADWNTFMYDIGFFVKMPRFSVPLVVKFHGSYTYLVNQLNYVPNQHFKQIDNFLIGQRADMISSVSNYTATISKSLFNIQKSIEILYNGIEFTESNYSIEKSNNLVIFTGALVKGKGVFSLMKAWNVVVKELPTAKLEIYGKGNKEELIRLLDENTRNTVSFLGHVHRTHLLGQLAKANVAVFPSYAECFSLAPIEAMSVGCPTIFTKRTSGHELINDGFNGVLVEPDDYHEIAEKIIEILKSEELQRMYSKNGIKTIQERFTIQKSVQEHIRFYTESIRDFQKDKQKR